MSFAAIAKRLIPMAEADTGSGGWFETSGANKLTGIYTLESPQVSGSNPTATYPYIVLTPVSILEDDSFEKHHVNALIQVSVWVRRRAGTVAHDGVTSRVRTVFHRQTPSAVIADGWTPTAIYLEREATPLIDEDAVHYVFEIRMRMERSA